MGLILTINSTNSSSRARLPLQHPGCRARSGGKRAADHHPGPRRPGGTDGGQPAGDGLLRAGQAGAVLRQLRRRAPRHAGEFDAARRRAAGALRHRARRRHPVLRRQPARRPAAGHGRCAHADRRQFGPTRRALRTGASRLPRDPDRRPGRRTPPRPRAHRQLGLAGGTGTRAGSAAISLHGATSTSGPTAFTCRPGWRPRPSASSS